MNDVQDPVSSLIIATGVEVEFGHLVEQALKQVVELLVAEGGVPREELADPEVQEELSGVKTRLEAFSTEYRELYGNFFRSHFTDEEMVQTAAAVQSAAVQRYLRCMNEMDRTLSPSFQALGQRMLQESMSA